MTNEFKVTNKELPREMMKYKDIIEFQDKNETVEDRKKAFSKMSEDEVLQLIMTCGTPWGKFHYTNIYREAIAKE